MRNFLLLIAIFLGADRAIGEDLCQLYSSVHQTKIIPKLKSGIPFKIKCVVVSKDGKVKQQTLHLNYDLWDELVEINTPVGSIETADLSSSKKKICQMFRFKELTKRGVSAVSFLLNVSEANLSVLLRNQLKKNSKGVFNISWTPLQKKSFERSILLYREMP